MFSNSQNRQKPLKLTGFPLLSEVSMQTSGQEIYSPPAFLLIVGTGGQNCFHNYKKIKQGTLLLMGW